MTDPAPKSHTLSIGASAGGFRVLAHLGTGGMGEVYKVQAPGAPPRALKLLLPALAQIPEMRQRFVNEARIQSKLDHPNVVRVETTLELESTAAMVMEFVEGKTLRARMREALVQGSVLPLPEVLEIFQQILAGVGHAHDRGIVHRDLKPNNVVLEALRGGGARVRVLDFGVAKLLQDEQTIKQLTRTGMAVGTLAYMSPEQIQASKDVTPRSDIFTLGVMLYELVVGTSPFKGDSEFEVMSRIVKCRFEPVAKVRPDLPAHVAEAIEMAMRHDPAARYVSCGEFARALQAGPSSGRLASELLEAATRPGVAPPATPGAASRPSKSGARALGAGRVACAAHPRAAAGWVCGSCQSALCPECAARAGDEPSKASCTKCGGAASAILVPPALAPAGRWLAAPALFLATPEWLGIGVGLGVASYLAASLAPGAWLLALVLQGLAAVRVLHVASQGHATTTLPESAEEFSDLFGPLLRTFAATALLWAPVAAWALLGDAPRLSHPLPLVMAGLALAYVPMAVLLAVTGESLAAAANPAVALRGIWAARSSYPALLAASALLAGGWAALRLLVLERPGELPLWATFLAESGCAALVLAWARLLGAYGASRWKELGLDAPPAEFVPILGKTPPKGAAPSRPVEAPIRPLEIELPLDEAPAAPAASAAPLLELSEGDLASSPGRSAPAAFDDADQPTVPGASGLDALIAEATLARDARRVLELYTGCRDWESLSARAHFDAGRAASSLGDLRTAAVALERAARLWSEDPVAPRALVLLARLRAERLDDASGADLLFREVIRRYPGTEAARFARTKVGAA